MAAPSARDRALARQSRLVAVVLIATFAIWIGAQWLGPQLGLPGRYVFLVDFLALAAFLWALIVAVGLWRQRNGPRGG